MPFTEHKNKYFSKSLKIILGVILFFHCVGAGSCQTREERYDAQLEKCVLQGHEDIAAGTRCLENLLKTYSDKSFINLFLAENYLELNYLDEAEKTINTFIAQYPKESSGYNVRCQILSDKNNFSEALKSCITAIQLAPEDTSYLRDYASVKEKSGDSLAAEVVYKQILLKNPNDELTIVALGRLYEKADRLDEAIETYEKLLKPGFELKDKVQEGIGKLKLRREKQLKTEKERKPKSKAAGKQ